MVMSKTTHMLPVNEEAIDGCEDAAAVIASIGSQLSRSSRTFRTVSSRLSTAFTNPKATQKLTSFAVCEDEQKCLQGRGKRSEIEALGS